MIRISWIKRCAFLVALAGMVVAGSDVLAATPPAAAGSAFDVAAESAILVDGESGQVLFQKNVNLRLPPASMVKIMTMLLVMEEVEAGRLKLDDMVTTSAYASKIGGSQVYLKEGEKFSVQELMKAVAIHSANDAAVALAEHVSGSVEAFVDAMNARAKQLGMQNTQYVNPDGLPSEKGQAPTFTTAHDLSVVARELLKYPKVLEWTSTERAEFRSNSQTILYNTNKLIGKYAGLDGLKTGHTDEAGWCLTATAKRDDVRLVSVVMRTASESARGAQTARLLDYGFRNFVRVAVAPKGEKAATLKIRNGWPGAVSVVPAQALQPLMPKGSTEQISKEVLLEKVSAPLPAGQRVGVILAKVGEKEIARVDLVLPRNVKKANFIVIFLRWVKGLFAGWFS